MGFLRTSLLVVVVLALRPLATPDKTPPLRLHPHNPHYLEFRGKPTVLISSAEHYGAVLNLDFDFLPYLNELHAHKLNVTRTWMGAYVEDPSSFGITNNTLAPAAGRFLAPWARSQTAGYANGGNKFDLSRWDPAFFTRLHKFVSEAGARGVVVEVGLFCPYYTDEQWKLSPLHPSNNVNGVAKGLNRQQINTLTDKGVTAIQDAYVRKVVTELNGYDNVYYELVNEPYSGGVSPEFQDHVAELITATEKALPQRHLISKNISNGGAKVVTLHPAVSVLNFHYAAPPDAVDLNYNMGKVLADDETGFRGTEDQVYRTEAWDFLLAGGAIFNNLDYSFTADHEDGTFPIPPKQPGGGGRSFRSQMTTLAGFFASLPFIEMAPVENLVKGGVPEDMSVRALAWPGHAYALYLRPLAGENNFSVRWSGTLTAPTSGTYTLSSLSNDGFRVWVDGKLVIDDWNGHSAKEDKAQVKLTGGRPAVLKIEYYQDSGGAVARLRWATGSQPLTTIPASAFRTPDGQESGLKGEYFKGRAFERLAMSRLDPTLDFDWGHDSPFVRRTVPADREQSVSLGLDLPAGHYRAEWIIPASGLADKVETFTHKGGVRTLASPRFSIDLALRIQRP